jgi:hypothetical protein
MTRLRAFLMAPVLFGGVCLTLGTLGTLTIEAGYVLTIYGVAVLGFATWVTLETYCDCRSQPGSPKLGRTA